MAGGEFTIADIAWYPWVRCLGTGYSAWEFLEVDSYTNVIRWLNECLARPSADLGLKVNSISGDVDYKEYHSPK